MVSLLAAMTVFATVDEAAVSALKHAATICDPRYECGGVVRRVNGGFEASGLITSNRPFGVDLGEFYGPDGAGHVRIAVVQPDDRIELIARRLGL